jgi:hypothetical protein
MNVVSLVETVRSATDCDVHEPAGSPVLEWGLSLPDDLRRFYKVCGGIELYRSGKHPIEVVSPSRFLRANPIIIGQLPGVANRSIPVE